MSPSATVRIDPCPAVALQQFLAMEPSDLFAIWLDLPPADLLELDGEYAGFVPFTTLPDDIVQANVHLLYRDDGRNGYWVGKAFHSEDGQAGEGHNVFRKPHPSGRGSAFVRGGRYLTSIEPSLIDGKPSLHMNYGAFNNAPGRSGLIDEIRCYAPGLYLGSATHPTEDGGRTEANGCFILAGPFNPYTGADDPDRELLA